jgi:hypothetical protein
MLPLSAPIDRAAFYEALLDPSTTVGGSVKEIAELTFRPQASSSELRTPMKAGALGIGMSDPCRHKPVIWQAATRAVGARRC